MVKISVITSVYNAETWLPKFLLAVNNQTLPEFEIIFIDANSTDSSLNLIKDFPFRCGVKVVVLPEDTRISVYQAWNRGVIKSTCDYVVNWNTDDLLYPASLAVYQSYLESDPHTDVFYGNHMQVFEQSYESLSHFRIWPEHNHNTLLQYCYCGPFPLLKKSAIIECGLFDEKYRYSSDYAMWLKLSKLNYRLRKIPEFIGAYFYRDESVSIANLEKAQEEDREIQLIYR